MIARLFVYGTLRRGKENHHRMGRSRFVANGSIPGLLVPVGPYTAIRRPAPRGARVTGELHELLGDDLDRRFAALDRFEGRGYRRVRTVVVTRTGHRHVAWTYVLAEGR